MLGSYRQRNSGTGGSSVVAPGDMNLTGYRLHQLAGDEEGVWSVWVNGNGRVTFRFEQENAILVDYRDYH